MADLRDIVPGYRDALEREEFRRNAAFLGVSELICGVEVQPLTLEHVCRLQCVGNPFLCGGVPSVEDVAVFLWAVSPQYSPRSKWRRFWFIRSIRKLPFIPAVEAIRAYIEEAFEDTIGGEQGGFIKSDWSGFASLVATLASEFGWTEREIMQMPIKRVWQYARIIQKRHDPKAWFPSKSGRIRQQWLDSQVKN